MIELSTPDLMQGTVELDAAAAHTIAAAMRAVAVCDGEHPREVALIQEFEAELPGGSSTLDLSTIQGEAAQEAFLKSVVLVAYADGRVTETERDLIASFARQIGIPEARLTATWTDIASSLLSSFAGVRTYRKEVVTIGKSMGLDEATIAAVLEDE
jgi:tellurite resistance protein